MISYSLNNYNNYFQCHVIEIDKTYSLRAKKKKNNTYCKVNH